MTEYSLLAARILNRPLLITPDKAQAILAVIAAKIGLDYSHPPLTAATAPERDFCLNANGIATISVIGTLVNRSAWLHSQSGLLSYEKLGQQLGDAGDDPKVKAVILDIDSPGGEAAGAFEVAARVRKLASVKPVFAVINAMAASSAYAIASGATRIITSPSGVAGSIGVVLIHFDHSESLKAEGLKPTIITAGAHKADANPFQPLPDSVKADLQREIDSYYDQFLKTVAAGRGNRLTIDMAKATEARIFIGHEAVKAGLADQVATIDEAIMELSKPLTRRTTMDEDLKSSTSDYAKGIGDAYARIAAITGDERISGDGNRLKAALELAGGSPDMSAAKVIEFIAANVVKDQGEPSTRLADRALLPDSLGEAAAFSCQSKPIWPAVVSTINQERKNR